MFPGDPGLTLHILGVDPFAEAPFRNYTRGTAAGVDIPRLLTRPGAVLLLEETAKRMGVSRRGTLSRCGSASNPLTPRCPASSVRGTK